MKNGDLKRIEVELDVRLPDYYARILLDDPFDGGVQEFYGEADEIIQENLFMRTESYVEEWPHHWLIIGDDGAGDDYFLDLSLAPSPVFFQDHERYRNPGDLARSVKQEAPSLEGFLDRVRKEVDRWRAIDQILDEDQHRIEALRRVSAAVEMPSLDDAIDLALDAFVGSEERLRLRPICRLTLSPRELEARSILWFEVCFGCCRLARLPIEGGGTLWLWRDDRAAEPGTTVLAATDVETTAARAAVARAIGADDVDEWWRDR